MKRSPRLVPQSLQLLAIGASIGCATAQAPVARPAIASSQPASAPLANTGRPARVAVRVGTVLFDGQEVGAVSANKLERVDGLYERVRSVRQDGTGGPYTFSIAPGTPTFAVKSVFQTAAFAGWPVAALETSAGTVEIHAFVPGPPGAANKSDLVWPEKVLVLGVRRGIIELWRQPYVAPASQTDAANAPPPGSDRPDL
jgi:hypothetical protein